jgi:hypothetical protein
MREDVMREDVMREDVMRDACSVFRLCDLCLTLAPDV